ncbi:interleukin-1 receptor-associated kinase 4 [Vigna unguiculata]|uniref:Interleukin-1 receptor-associated kinase 4 n=1 Tax=Vigna unguiculata TaxID=3917 RepID=A0A4D6NG82_VIGUN|nr:interleukin-1 receptor-associated kinase 4 [Vigna unguiculata]
MKSMETTTKPIEWGTILFLLLLSFPRLSKADDIFQPPDLLSINCGSSSNLSTLYGRNWIGDTNTELLSVSRGSLIATALTKTTIQGPYDSARLSFSNFTYSIFNLTAGPKFLRLFFFSTSYYNNFNRSKAVFSVKAGPYTLLQRFNASLDADSGNDPARSNILFREYCINLQEGQNLIITFIPSSPGSYAFINGIEIVSMPSYLSYTDPNVDIDGLPKLVGGQTYTIDNNLALEMKYSSTGSYAFINGIEIVSMPSYLYYTDPNVDIDGLPKLVGGQTYTIENNLALEMKYRLRFGDRSIPGSEDTGMLRTWDVHNQYITTQSAKSLDIDKKTKLNFRNTPYTAPDQVYLSLVNMGPNASINMGFNLTWQLPVDPGFTYMLRLHFCQLNPKVIESGDQIFLIYIQDHLVEDYVDIFSSGGNQRGVPLVRDYAVIIKDDNQKKVNLSVKLHPHDKSMIKDAQLNAIELFKISDTTGNLAVPDPRIQDTEISHENPIKQRRGTTRTLVAVVVAVSGVVLLSFIMAFFIIKRKKNVAFNNGSNKKDGTSRGGGSSFLPTNLCRHFSISEIVEATNNFDELFVVGVGGFGNVFKGYIDDSTPVAIKRLKPGSQQGLDEFMNEIEMLSQLRHLHLVSLIGYCYEINEMILVYDFMDRGTLRDHLYETDNPPLSWKQRLQICIGAARGLHYLHTGTKQMIIHRDVKSTNILLDEKWVAKVSDFGLSRIGPTGSSMTHVSTQVKGSVGYLDPEYYKRQRLTEKSDVYSYGVVLLEVLCGRQPLLRMVEKQQVSLVDWAKHRYEKGFLGEIVDPALKDQIAPHCLRKFGELALSCLLEDGTQRPSMNDVVGVLEFVLQLQLQDDANVNAGSESGGDYEDSTTEDMFSSSHSSVHVSDYSNSSGFNPTSYACMKSNRLSEHVFSEIKDPKGR